MHPRAKHQITPPPQSLDLQFSACQWKQKIGIGHYENVEKWL